MKTFLCKGKRPLRKWSLLPNESYYEGVIPNGYSLAVVPGGDYIIIDVDRHEKSLDGFLNLPHSIKKELEKSLCYPTKNNGMHYWMKYTGKKPLGNKTSGIGIDLRVGSKGYVIYYPDNDIRKQMDKVKQTSPELNIWLEELFSYKDKK